MNEGASQKFKYFTYTLDNNTSFMVANTILNGINSVSFMIFKTFIPPFYAIRQMNK